jgi:hypothetical protein
VARSCSSDFIHGWPRWENDVRATPSIWEFPDNVAVTMIGQRDGDQPMHQAKLALLVAGHATFLATFVWLFH